jgi:hypothetical protein
MPETPTQKSEAPHASTPARFIMVTCNHLVQLIPPKARISVLTGALVLVGLAVLHIPVQRFRHPQSNLPS